jgi:hypothetical protein
MKDTVVSMDRCAFRYGTLTKELAMDEKPDTIREAVGVFGSATELQVNRPRIAGG